MADINVIKQQFGSLTRILISMFFGWLVRKQVFDQKTADSLISPTADWLLIIAAAIIPIVWSYMKNRFNIDAIKTALHLKPHDSIEDVVRIAKDEHKLTTTI